MQEETSFFTVEVQTELREFVANLEIFSRGRFEHVPLYLVGPS